ncbi:MAG: hypothetical protein NC311_01420 [Muribaculaceae bacterium]|nr:hypothetical protein [Muribaculaceae bacterium]
MTRKQPVEIVFSTTQNYLPYYIVLAHSIASNLNGRPFKIHVLYTESFNKIPDADWLKYTDCMYNTLSRFPGAQINFCDITDKMHLLDGQNIGMWGNQVSLTHYIYLLSQIALPDSDKVIYMDGDMICNCDLSDVFDTDMSEKLILMAEHSGGDDLSEKELSPTASNSGFLVLNLKQWRITNTMERILEFGRRMPTTSFCDQALLYYYFAVNNPEKISYVDKLYNIFPGAFPNIPTRQMKVLHFTSYRDPKPWLHLGGYSWRGSDIWWYHARQTAFYENFIDAIVDKKIHIKSKKKETKLQRLWRHISILKF